MINPLDEFFEFDVTMGAEAVKCSYCGAAVSCSLLLDDEVECPECGKKFKKQG
jgi:uncharacterized Zn-finger protein